MLNLMEVEKEYDIIVPYFQLFLKWQICWDLLYDDNQLLQDAFWYSIWFHIVHLIDGKPILNFSPGGRKVHSFLSTWSFYKQWVLSLSTSKGKAREKSFKHLAAPTKAELELVNRLYIVKAWSCWSWWTSNLHGFPKITVPCLFRKSMHWTLCNHWFSQSTWPICNCIMI